MSKTGVGLDFYFFDESIDELDGFNENRNEEESLLIEPHDTNQA